MVDYVKLDDISRDAWITLQFYLKSFLFILKSTYNTYYLFCCIIFMFAHNIVKYFETWFIYLFIHNLF